MEKLLLITPPFVQPNAPYPATAYLSGYLRRKGYAVSQADLSVELLNRIFSKGFLEKVFEEYTESGDENLSRIHALRSRYTETVGTVMRFLRGGQSALAALIVNGDFLPQAGRFASAGDLEPFFGSLGTVDCAKYLCTLYLQDLSDLIRAVVTPHFEIVRYGESLSLSVENFGTLESELQKPLNLIERQMVELLEVRIAAERPTVLGVNVSFPGNLLPALRCAQYVRQNHPAIRIALGGGYPTTELRSLSDPGIFSYVDYIILDDGELPMERILSGGELLHTHTKEGYHEGSGKLTHEERGCPDFGGLPHELYFSLVEVTNPMHRLWSDGRWNKMTLAHGCYWARCAFCDTSLDYIRRYETVPAATLVDWMEAVIAQTGSRGFHFTDEAAPPALLRELSLEILRRGLKVSWWTNIRFEAAFTGDLAQLMAAAGCIAVSGGLETASDRLLERMEKGVTIEQATLAMRNFYYAGILVHTYLMYAFPGQRMQECIDSLEVVRQLFRAQLIDSAFWHRYAMTVHSPSGRAPENFGVKARGEATHPFANNEIAFTEHRDYNPERVGEALREALSNYLCGEAINRPAHKWFGGKDTLATTVEPTLITDQLIKPDASRIFHEQARLVWIGVEPRRTATGLGVYSNSGYKSLSFKDEECDFLLRVIAAAGDLSKKYTLSEAKAAWGEWSEEPFLIFYHSKKWDILRGYGLLQL